MRPAGRKAPDTATQKKKKTIPFHSIVPFHPLYKGCGTVERLSHVPRTSLERKWDVERCYTSPPDRRATTAFPAAVR